MGSFMMNPVRSTKHGIAKAVGILEISVPDGIDRQRCIRPKDFPLPPRQVSESSRMRPGANRRSCFSTFCIGAAAGVALTERRAFTKLVPTVSIVL